MRGHSGPGSTVVRVIGLTRDPARFLTDVLDRAENQGVTYAEMGATRAASLPAGYRHDRTILHVGVGDAVWDQARDAIRSWAAHHAAGITITPPNAPVAESTTVVASRTFGPLVIAAPCRVVYATDEPKRFGFAYGTLPGHPEKGEEAFHVVRHEDGRVVAEIVAFSRPDDRATKMASVVARQIQTATIRRYLEGIRNYVTGPR